MSKQADIIRDLQDSSSAVRKAMAAAVRKAVEDSLGAAVAKGAAQPVDDGMQVIKSTVTHPGGRREVIKERRPRETVTPPLRDPLAPGSAVARDVDAQQLSLERLRTAYAVATPTPTGGLGAVSKDASPTNELWAREGLQREQTRQLIQAIRSDPDSTADRIEALLDSDLDPPGSPVTRQPRNGPPWQ